jgi:hypothetical protein
MVNAPHVSIALMVAVNKVKELAVFVGVIAIAIAGKICGVILLIRNAYPAISIFIGTKLWKIALMEHDVVGFMIHFC